VRRFRREPAVGGQSVACVVFALAAALAVRRAVAFAVGVSHGRRVQHPLPLKRHREPREDEALDFGGGLGAEVGHSGQQLGALEPLAPLPAQAAAHQPLDDLAGQRPLLEPLEPQRFPLRRAHVFHALNARDHLLSR
jgi:hypothetical protein